MKAPPAPKPLDSGNSPAGEVTRTNLEEIIRLERESIRKMTRAERISEAISRFAGSQPFILIHLLWFAAWILVNLGCVPGVKIFDPLPFSFLTMMVSLEAILLTAFVLISQNRLGHQADKRAQLDLQVNLLAEQEITKVLQMLDLICSALKIPKQDREIGHMMQKTDLTSIAREIDRKVVE